MTVPGSTAIAVPVRAPGRVWVQEIWEASFSTGGRNYQLYVYPCTDVRVYFGHLVSLSEKLATAMQKVPPPCNSFSGGTAMVTTCRHEQMSVMLESGEPLGTGPDTAGVDFGMLDVRRAPAAFVRLTMGLYSFTVRVPPHVPLSRPSHLLQRIRVRVITVGVK